MRFSSSYLPNHDRYKYVEGCLVGPHFWPRYVIFSGKSEKTLSLHRHYSISTCCINVYTQAPYLFEKSLVEALLIYKVMHNVLFLNKLLPLGKYREQMMLLLPLSE